MPKTLKPHSPLTPLRIVASLLIASVTPLLSSVAAPSHQQATVIHVIDGDTVKLKIGSRQEHVRLIGIDTPEARPNRRADIQSSRTHQDQKTILKLGQQSTEYTRRLLPKGSTVKLESDREPRDHYNRLLGYVWLPNGTMANEEILRAGYGYLLTVPPNIKYRDRLGAAFSEARKEKRGLWADTANGAPSREASKPHNHHHH
jgi:micrococcal nuclease